MSVVGKNFADGPRRLVFFGDSICVGQGVSIHLGWVTRIAAQLNQLVGEEIVVVNASVNGNTSRQALERMPYEVQSHGVDILIVQFGMNDCNYWLSDRGLPRVSESSFAANLEEIIARGFTFGAKTIVLNTNHMTNRGGRTFPLTKVSYEQSNGRYNEIIRSVARRMGAQVVLNDVEEAFRARIGDDRARLADLLLPDGLHLSVAGHDLYFELTMPIIEHSVRTLIQERCEQ
jgi:acyl-CoA thioesterase-1